MLKNFSNEKKYVKIVELQIAGVNKNLKKSNYNENIRYTAYDDIRYDDYCIRFNWLIFPTIIKKIVRTCLGRRDLPSL